MDRSDVIKTLRDHIKPNDRIVSALGFISRELFALSSEFRHQCFYCQGAMGSVIPFSLGISLAQPQLRVFALEGDGSLLMNLGSLATLQKYTNQVVVIVFDNACYESTGGQPSHSEELKLNRVGASLGIESRTASTTAGVKNFLSSLRPHRTAMLVARVDRSIAAPRIKEPLMTMTHRFAASLTIRACIQNGDLS